MSRIRKYVLVSSAGIILIAGVVVFWLYRDIRSITIEDIQSRQQLNEGEAVEGLLPAKRLPGFLHNAVHQAIKLSGEEIESQDATDAAAILLNSKLSIKEMRALLTMSEQQLSNEEKQAIRELLLEKLTNEEIEALRSITKKYGKHLSILDPDYPIEAVGIEDDVKRQQIVEQARKQEGASTLPQQSVTDDEKPDSPEKQDSEQSGSIPQISEPEKLQKSSEKQELIEKYESRLEKVKAQCTEEAEEWIRKGMQSVKGSGAEKNPADPTSWLESISAAEQKCDQQFQDVLVSAENEFAKNQFSFEVGQLWQQEYELSKDQLRDKAMQQLQF